MVKDIARAIEQEKIYLALKESGAEVKVFDFIGPCGYSDINEFYWDKQLYLLKTTPYVNEEEPYITLDFTTKYFQNKTPAFLWTITCPTMYAFVPNEFTDFDKLRQYGLEPIRIGYSAQNGIIISADGDLRIFLIYPGNLEIRSDHFLGFFRDFLFSYYPNIEVNKNDILVNGKKVLGSVQIPHMSGMGVFVAQVSFSDQSELIKKICGKTVKTPGFLDPEIISPYELKDGFAEWLGM